MSFFLQFLTFTELFIHFHLLVNFAVGGEGGGKSLIEKIPSFFIILWVLDYYYKIHMSNDRFHFQSYKIYLSVNKIKSIQKFKFDFQFRKFHLHTVKLYFIIVKWIFANLIFKFIFVKVILMFVKFNFSYVKLSFIFVNLTWKRYR